MPATFCSLHVACGASLALICVSFRGLRIGQVQWHPRHDALTHIVFESGWAVSCRRYCRFCKCCSWCVARLLKLSGRSQRVHSLSFFSHFNVVSSVLGNGRHWLPPVVLVSLGFFFQQVQKSELTQVNLGQSELLMVFYEFLCNFPEEGEDGVGRG